MHLANPLVVNESHWNEDISQNLLHCKSMIYMSDHVSRKVNCCNKKSLCYVSSFALFSSCQ